MKESSQNSREYHLSQYVAIFSSHKERCKSQNQILAMIHETETQNQSDTRKA